MGSENENWMEKFDRELQRGRKARREGNEGMARVCARRAAGLAARAYFEKTRGSAPESNVLNLLRMLKDSPAERDSVREVAGHFYLRITPEHVLPEDVDLLAEVAWLRSALFPDS